METKIDKLTKEQEEKIPIYLQKYYDRVYKNKKLNKKFTKMKTLTQAKKHLNKIAKLAKNQKIQL